MKVKESRKLGDYRAPKELFPSVGAIVEPLGSREDVHRALLEQVELAPSESFLLPAVVDFISRVVKRVDPGYTLLSFERWLDGHLEEEEAHRIRGKIVGRYIPREEYQVYFPIGLGRLHPGSHIVTGHNPPDLDTSVASFWGWVDAFAARVAEGGHQWNLPGGAATGQIGRLFDEIVGSDLVALVARKDGRLAATASDLMTSSAMELQRGHALTTSLDHGGLDKCIILVDDEGSFLGTWRSSDVEGFRTLVLLVTDCWRWFSSTFYDRIVSLFAKPEVRQGDVAALLALLFATELRESEPLEDISEEQTKRLDRTLREVLGVENGLEARVSEFAELPHFQGLRASMEQLASSDLYGEGGELIADRAELFSRVQVIVREMQSAMRAFRTELDRLEVAMEIKRRIFHREKQYVTIHADLDEIRAAMGPHHFLPVVELVGERLLPVGTVCASSLQQERLGTVSLRDFCNRDEVKIAPHFETISVVDHHRTSLETSSFPTVVLGDVQSCNTLLAELSMAINDRYAVGGELSTSSSLRVQQRELLRRIAERTRGEWFVHPEREMCEYLSYLFAILDDTDLLSRVTRRDVEVVAALINRMVSILEGCEVEVVDFDDLPRGADFPKLAARRLLENKQLYSLYSRIYGVREEEVAEQIALCVEGKESTLFTDTKEQKGCARVGQMKLFPNNFAIYQEQRERLRAHWMERAKEICELRPELQLHIQMVSTIAGAEEVYRGGESSYSHHDEIWVFVPSTEEGYRRLASFLSGFKGGVEGALHVELDGEEDERLHEIFERHFEKRIEPVSVAVVKCDPGRITSRKSHITPYLPVS